MTQELTERPVRGYAALLILTGIIGWMSSFALTMDKFHLLEDPDGQLTCDFNILVQCSANLNSWQGSVFGFPNSLVGLAAFTVPIVLGLALLAGARFARWFWWGFLSGTFLGFVWVLWFMSQSFFEIGKLCPWCTTMWIAMIPLFVVTLIRVLRDHTGGSERYRRVMNEVSNWTWVILVALYLILALLIHIFLDPLAYL